jgi:hypothetical protein
MKLLLLHSLMWQTSTTMIELQSLLLTHQARLQANLQSANSSYAHLTMIPASKNDNSAPEAHFTSGPSSKNFSFSQILRGSLGQYYNQQSRSYRGKGDNRGRGRGRFNPQFSDITC